MHENNRDQRIEDPQPVEDNKDRDRERQRGHQPQQHTGAEQVLPETVIADDTVRRRNRNERREQRRYQRDDQAVRQVFAEVVAAFGEDVQVMRKRRLKDPFRRQRRDIFVRFKRSQDVGDDADIEDNQDDNDGENGQRGRQENSGFRLHIVISYSGASSEPSRTTE